MSTGIIVAVVVVAALVIGVMTVMRRRRLQQRFGPEYDRVVGEHDSKLKAEGELAERERRVRGLDIQPLTDSARAGYADQWAAIQERFVDAPADAVAGSQLLVAAVMNERGYPTEHPDKVLADLSVEHSDTLDRYRAAEEISKSAALGGCTWSPPSAACPSASPSPAPRPTSGRCCWASSKPARITLIRSSLRASAREPRC